GWENALHSEDRHRTLAAFYDAATTGGDFAMQCRLRTRQGMTTWVQAAALPLRTGAGQLDGYLMTVTDITQRMQAERLVQFLADATSVLNASLDYEIALNAVAKLAVPTLADACTAHVVENGALRLVAIAHTDPNKSEQAQELAHWHQTNDVGD